MVRPPVLGRPKGSTRKKPVERDPITVLHDIYDLATAARDAGIGGMLAEKITNLARAFRKVRARPGLHKGKGVSGGGWSWFTLWKKDVFASQEYKDASSADKKRLISLAHAKLTLSADKKDEYERRAQHARKLRKEAGAAAAAAAAAAAGVGTGAGAGAGAGAGVGGGGEVAGGRD